MSAPGLSEHDRARRVGIGGSDAAAIVGVHPWMSALELYSYKRAELDKPDLSGSERVQWGNRLEAVIAEAYAEETGYPVRDLRAADGELTLQRHAEHEHMLGFIDRQVDAQPPFGLECKNVDRLIWRQKWGEPGTDQVPNHYLIQCQHYMAITGWLHFDLAALIGGNQLAIYPIQRSEMLINSLIEAEARFWHTHVEAGVPPEPATLNDLAILYPRDERESVYADAETASLVEQLKNARAKRQELEKLEGELRFRIQRYLGDAGALLGDGGKALVTYRQETRRRIDTQALKRDYPELAATLTTEAESRVFRVK